MIRSHHKYTQPRPDRSTIIPRATAKASLVNLTPRMSTLLSWILKSSQTSTFLLTRLTGSKSLSPSTTTRPSSMIPTTTTPATPRSSAVPRAAPRTRSDPHRDSRRRDMTSSQRVREILLAPPRMAQSRASETRSRPLGHRSTAQCLRGAAVSAQGHQCRGPGRAPAGRAILSGIERAIALIVISRRLQTLRASCSPSTSLENGIPSRHRRCRREGQGQGPRQCYSRIGEEV